MAIWLKMTEYAYCCVFSFVTSPLLFTVLQLHFEPIICRRTLFFCNSCHFSLSHQLFRTKGEVSDFFFVSYCSVAFFQHHIAGVWREHLLKVFQKFEKIEADATLSTLVEFSVLGQTIRFASLGSVKFAVTLSYGLLLAVSHSLCHTIYIAFSRPFCLRLILTRRFARSHALNDFKFLVFASVLQWLSTMKLKSAVLLQKGGC